MKSRDLALVAVPLVLATILGVLPSCKEETSTEPSSFAPGKRSYTWTSDTLFFLGNAQTTMQSIFASTASNVYVVGHCEVSGGRMWRYNGTSWQTVNLSSIRGYLNAISGSSENDIWIAGGQAFLDSASNQYVDSTLIVHYDGASWRQITGFERRKELWCVTALSSTNVWAGGSDGVLYRLNGSTWELYETGSQYFFSSIAAMGPNEAYAMGHVSDSAPPVDSSGSFLFRFDGNSWQKIDSVMNTPGAAPAHMGAGVYTWGGLLYTIGSEVYRRSGNEWIKLVDAQVGHMSQSSPQNIIAVGRAVYHFNGIDWFQFTQFYSYPGLWFDCYTDNNVVFIVGNDNERSIILRGQ